MSTITFDKKIQISSTINKQNSAQKGNTSMKRQTVQVYKQKQKFGSHCLKNAQALRKQILVETILYAKEIKVSRH